MYTQAFGHVRDVVTGEAIEGADVMLYGVSLAYKESANVSPHASPATDTCAGSALCRHPARHQSADSALCLIRWRNYILQCRLEVNYGHQQELDMIPLKMQNGSVACTYLLCLFP
eukprot:COSAG06_NODE_9753_length_1827_cov_1.127315_3_plen_115_part_00